MNYITCPHCGESYPEFDAAHVCSRGPYAVKLQSDTNTNSKERLRELAQQAGIKYGVRDDVYYSKSFDGVYRLDMEKFAELIVRECVQTLIDNTPERYTNEATEEDWDKGYDRAMKDCVHHIQEHFGVK